MIVSEKTFKMYRKELNKVLIHDDGGEEKDELDEATLFSNDRNITCYNYRNVTGQETTQEEKWQQ